MNNLDKKISRYPVPEIEDLPKDIQEIMLKAKKNMGFIPNVFKALAHRPDELRAFLAYNKALMNREDSNLTAGDKELMIIAFSNNNGCVYCVQSHSAQYRLATKDPKTADQVSVNYRESDITPRQRAMIDYAMKVTNKPAEICEEDFEILKKYGFTDEDIWDINGITAFYNMSNRLMTFAAVRPDDEFYMLGRK